MVLVLVKFHNLRVAQGFALKFYTSVAKGLKLKVKKFRGLFSTVLELTGEKLVDGGGFLTSPSWRTKSRPRPPIFSPVSLWFGFNTSLIFSTETFLSNYHLLLYNVLNYQLNPALLYCMSLHFHFLHKLFTESY